MSGYDQMRIREGRELGEELQKGRHSCRGWQNDISFNPQVEKAKEIPRKHGREMDRIDKEARAKRKKAPGTLGRWEVEQGDVRGGGGNDGPYAATPQ